VFLSSHPAHFHPLRDGQLDLMADLLTAHLDIDAIVGLLEHGPPARPTITTALSE
jgi:adenosylcobyric acid synthase